MYYKRSMIFLVLLAFSNAASATLMTGTITSDSGEGMYATYPWDGGDASLSYSVQQVGSLWQYDYHWATTRKDLSHIIFEVSDSFTLDNIFDGTSSEWSLGTWGDQGNSNPGIPSEFYGLKFDGDYTTDTYLTIMSDRMPMWGDFYAKDGKYCNCPVYAYNTGFGLDTLDGKILVPDTYTSQVPEPSALALMALGLGTMVQIGRRRKNK